MHGWYKRFAGSTALVLALSLLGCAPASLPDASQARRVDDTPIRTTSSSGTNETPSESPATNPQSGINFDDTGPLVAEPNPQLSCPSYDPNSCGEIRPLRKMRNRYPIVLAHGLGGFKEFATLDYFYQIPGYLRGQGYAVYVSTVDPFNDTSVRAGQLGAFVNKVLACSCSGKVNLIGHSQEGSIHAT